MVLVIIGRKWQDHEDSGKERARTEERKTQKRGELENAGRKIIYSHHFQG
jgi:hypothetical protein